MYCHVFMNNSVFDSITTCVLFADDAKLHTLIKCRYDFVNLQSSLDRILDWSNEHRLPISVKKVFLHCIGYYEHE